MWFFGVVFLRLPSAQEGSQYSSCTFLACGGACGCLCNLDSFAHGWMSVCAPVLHDPTALPCLHGMAMTP